MPCRAPLAVVPEADRDPRPDHVVAVVLAAGAGRRFGAVKQLAALDGRPLLEHAVAAVVSDPGVHEVVVVLGAHRERIAAEADLSAATVVHHPGWAAGPSSSLRAGLRAARDRGATCVVVALGDQPWSSPAALRRVLGVPGEIVRAVHGGRPGHPVVLRGAAIERVAEDGVGDPRWLVRAMATPVEVGDLDAGADVDVPGDLVGRAT